MTDVAAFITGLALPSSVLVLCRFRFQKNHDSGSLAILRNQFLIWNRFLSVQFLTLGGKRNQYSQFHILRNRHSPPLRPSVLRDLHRSKRESEIRASPCTFAVRSVPFRSDRRYSKQMPLNYPFARYAPLHSAFANTEIGCNIDLRLRESHLLAPSPRGARVHAT